MLPFMAPKKMASVIMAARKKDGTAGESKEEGEVDSKLISAAEALISAVHAKDATAVAQAICDAVAHIESTETEEVNE